MHFPVLSSLPPQRPLLEQLLLQQLIQKNRIQEEHALLFRYLFACAKAGYPSAYIDANSLYPSLEEIADEELLSQKDSLLLLASAFPKTDLAIPQEHAIHRLQNFFYLQRFFVEETRLIQGLTSHLANWQGPKIDRQALEHRLQQEMNCLTKEQAKAIVEGCTQPIFLLTGGPGTGKTYTASLLIKHLINGLSKSEQTSFCIHIAAPTGKAAMQLQKTLQKALGFAHTGVKIEATTLHQLLRLSPHSPKKPHPLFADLVVVDESSMIDIPLMSALLQSLKANSQLILLGDPYQLPSIEGGAPFAEFVQHPLLPRVHLTECKRVESAMLLSFAAAVGSGKIDTAMQHLKEEQPELVLYPPDLTLLDLLVQLSHRFPCALDKEPDPDLIVSAFDTFRILCPLRKGLQGTDFFNAFLQNQLRAKHSPWNIFPLLITANNHAQQLFNGEGGVLVEEMTTGMKYALFPSKIQGSPPRKIPLSLLPSHEIAYCLSIHKSQGSEFEEVCLLLPEKGENITKECMYTAITRAKKKLSLFDPNGCLKSLLISSETQFSSLQYRLCQTYTAQS